MNHRIAFIVTLIGVNLIACGCSDTTTIALRKGVKETQERNDARIKQIVDKAKVEAEEASVKEKQNEITWGKAQKAAEDKAVAREKIERKASDQEIERLRVEKVESELVSI